jgi:hypothetical protein
MPVITLAGSEENSMGRGGLDQPGRRRFCEDRPSGPSDPDDGDELLTLDEALPEDAPAGADAPLVIQPTEADVEEFLASHTPTEEQAALLELFQSGTGNPETVWASLVDSITDSFALHMIEQLNPY